ncbi:MAG: NADH-quinone oxidoreductase subunit NuoG [candidate division Zixibacteria bacterium]|nr:NADH-quinone oxidoreductase subunit NuoG [candidate division Zixibacteria bacterium]
MPAINLTIDGKPVQVEKGQTILQACQKLGLYVPTFCWDSRMDPIGACRICLVEVEKMPKLQVSCTIPAAEGMVVHTQTGRAKDGRQSIMELMLANHPLDCPTCDKGGECDLQDVAFLTRKDSSPMSEPKRRFNTDPGSTFDERQIGPLVYLTMNRCIVCFKCVRFTSEIAHEGDMGAFERGGHTQISSAIGEAVKNEFSGNTIEICPVGALTSKPFRYKIRTWLTQKKASVCNFCSDGCNLTLWVGGSKIQRATSRRNDTVDEGWICDKGRFGVDIVNHPQRLTSPFINKEGKRQEVSWDDAFEYAANRLKTIKDKNGPEAIAAIGSAHCSNEDNYVLQKFFRTVIGTNHIDHRVFYRNPLSGMDSAKFGMTNAIPDLEKADLIVVVGCDLTTEHPILGLRVKKAAGRLGKTLIVANNRKTKLGRFAARELVYNFGTEVSLLNSLSARLVGQGLVNREQVSIDAGFESWIKSQDSTRAEKTTGLPSADLETLAESIGKAKSCILLLGRDVIVHHQNADVLNSAANLSHLAGLTDKENSGLNLLWEYGNSQGAIDMGALPDLLPGSASLADTNYRTKLEEAWKAKLPGKPGYNLKLILEAVERGEVRGLYVMQEDLIENFPDRAFVQRALSKLEFLCVQTTFPDEMTKLAHLVLPGTSFAEKDGTYTSVERRVQKAQTSIPSVGNSRPDWRILSELSLWMQGPFRYNSAQEITDEIARLLPDYSGAEFLKLGLSGKRINANSRESNGTFQFTRPEFRPVSMPPDRPFVLITGNVVYHSGTVTSRSENLRQVSGESYCEISVPDGEKLQIESGEWIQVSSSNGSLKLKARISENVSAGTVFVPMNFTVSPVNLLQDKDSQVDTVKISKIKD